MSSYRWSDKSIRSHSIHVAIDRDYQRIQATHKQHLKLEKEFLNLERKLNSHAKWNERADHRNARHNSNANLSNPQDQPSITLKEYLAREKIKQENISNAKKIANGNIRRNTNSLLFSINHKTG